jgi:mannosyl-3-phosphoglycerate phosphatase
VVSDIDGTLLDKETYSFDEARPALAALAERNIPVVLVSSKTRAEIEPLREELALDDPFVVENGGAAYLPRGYLDEEVGTRDPSGSYDVLRWGTPYEEVVAMLQKARETTGADLKGFSDLDADQVATLTGLSLYEARRAKVREFDEPFWIEGEEDERSIKALEVLASRLTLTRGGRFYHIMGNCDKGRAVQELLHHYRASRTPADDLVSAGLGDARNDLPFLQVVDRAYVVAGADGRPDPELIGALPRARAVGVAPRGWTEGVMDFLSWLDEGPG